MSPKKPARKKTATKKPTRMVAKVSPLKGMSVDDYLRSKVSGWQAEAMKRVVALVRREAPQAVHAVKWSQPIFEHNGPFAWVKAATAHVTFGFWRGAELADPAGVLEGGDRMKHVKLKSAADADAPHLAAFVREAVRLNGIRGDPTRR